MEQPFAVAVDAVLAQLAEAGDAPHVGGDAKVGFEKLSERRKTTG
jgi:hypothetical protein